MKIFNNSSFINIESYDSNKKTILFFFTNFPEFDKDSGSNRIFEIINIFKNNNFNVILVINDSNMDHLNYIKYYFELGFILYFRNKFLNTYESIKKYFKHIDFIWFYGPDSLKNHYDNVNKYVDFSKSIFDMVDIHFMRYYRAIKLYPFKISYYKKYFKYLNIETKLSKKIDLILTISENEKKIMSNFHYKDKISVITNIHSSKISINERSNFINSKGIIFIGSTHDPNIDAVKFLYNEIMPIVWKKIPNLSVKIIGNINEKIKIKSTPNFEFLGYVKDTSTLFKNSKLLIAPLRYGAGVKGKIAQAFEYYLPVVTTSIGAEGMYLKNKKNALISDNHSEIANNIILLYENEELWNELSINSKENLKYYSEDLVLNFIKKL